MKDETAVSPVIGVILMVAITVILAAVIAVFGFGFGSSMNQKGPTASIVIQNIGDTTGIPDIKIVHKAGDRLVAGEWRISIVNIGEAPAYILSSTDFQAGDAIITTNLTNKGIVNVTNSAITADGGTQFELNTKYEIKIMVLPYGTLVTDAVVLVR